MIVTDSPACRINGLTHLNLAKLDVLDTLDEVKIGVRYRAKDGTILSSVPADLEILEGVTVGGGEQSKRCTRGVPWCRETPTSSDPRGCHGGWRSEVPSAEQWQSGFGREAMSPLKCKCFDMS